MSKKQPQPRFPQLDRLADYLEDAPYTDEERWKRLHRHHWNPKRERLPVDEYIGREPDDD